jgi:hypothetical protein
MTLMCPVRSRECIRNMGQLLEGMEQLGKFTMDSSCSPACLDMSICKHLHSLKRKDAQIYVDNGLINLTAEFQYTLSSEVY